ncbi:hypothetical protein ACA910_016902 [Epithemia clementina (nom. ined.)]
MEDGGPNHDEIEANEIREHSYCSPNGASVLLLASTQRNLLVVNQFTATGIDSAEEVVMKYKDSTSLISKLQALNKKQQGKKRRRNLDVAVHHNVNAILSPISQDNTNQDTAMESISGPPATFVIFNHPHLGMENARLHSQFLSHLFYSVRNGWMKKDGRFYLTLATGQWERWEAHEAANKSGLVLLTRTTFQAPRSQHQQEWKQCYQQRRHQTGKSFAGRATESETFTFCNQEAAAEIREEGIHTTPFWFTPDHNNKRQRNAVEADDGFFCCHCSKTFREERSLKNHIRSKHENGDSTNKGNAMHIRCPNCPRQFESRAALSDHINATHSAIHSNIQPEWSQRSHSSDVHPNQGESQRTDISHLCNICGATFATLTEKAKHLTDFVPLPLSSLEQPSHQCAFCKKDFRDKRAKLQHENFCNLRSAAAN